MTVAQKSAITFLDTEVFDGLSVFEPSPDGSFVVIGRYDWQPEAESFLRINANGEITRTDEEGIFDAE